MCVCVALHSMYEKNQIVKVCKSQLYYYIHSDAFDNLVQFNSSVCGACLCLHRSCMKNNRKNIYI